MPPGTAALQAAFLVAYARVGGIVKAAAACKQDRDNHSHWIDTWEDYPARFAVAHQTYIESLEMEVDRRAVKGIERLKFYQGELIKIPIYDADGKPILGDDGQPVLVPYVEHLYSDNLLMFRLKKLRPEYREASQPAPGGDSGPEAFAAKLRDAVREIDDLHSPSESS